jgi:hypothetical protein
MKRTPLVCQHLENVSREVLEEYQGIVRQYIRRRSGIYALFRRGKLYYVGLAKSLSGRLKQHLRDQHRDSWDRFSVYLTIGDTHMKGTSAPSTRAGPSRPASAGTAWWCSAASASPRPPWPAAVAQRRRTCNGWTFWRYERAPGDWPLLDELRR